MSKPICTECKFHTADCYKLTPFLHFCNHPAHCKVTFSYITGVESTDPVLCEDVNGKGQCGYFEEAPLKADVPTSLGEKLWFGFLFLIVVIGSIIILATSFKG